MYLQIPSCQSIMGGGGVCMRKARYMKLAVGVDLNGCGCAGMCENVLAQDIYCSKPNPKSGSQSGSRFRKGPGTQTMRIIREYYLATVIAIRPLTQPLTCEMGSFIFAAMIRLKVASTTWEYLPIIPSTKRNIQENKFRYSCQFLSLLSFFIFFT